MAKIENSYVFGQRHYNFHDWDKWFDGNTYRLEHMVDFKCRTDSMVKAAILAAKKRGVVIDVETTTDGDVMLRAVKR